MLRRALFIALGVLALSGVSRAGAADDGRVLYEQRCTACHTIGNGDRVGPDLRGATERRSEEWLLRFITEPDKMLASKDETATRLFEKYNRIAMPKLGLSEAEARNLIAHLREAGAAAGASATPAAAAPVVAQPAPELAAAQSSVLTSFLVLSAIIIVVFAAVGLSTRTPAEVDVKRAYGVRRVLFIGASAVVVVLLALTLPRQPYASPGAQADRVVYVAARQFEFIYSDEPIVSAADIGRVRTLSHLDLKAGSTIEFRVTGLDVNHGFGIYSPQRQIVAQTQAMPGFVNRLFVKLDQPGQYKVLCLEYCAAGHHLMQSGLTVN